VPEGREQLATPFEVAFIHRMDPRCRGLLLCQPCAQPVMYHTINSIFLHTLPYTGPVKPIRSHLVESSLGVDATRSKTGALTRADPL
jgi:hypothetical protein